MIEITKIAVSGILCAVLAMLFKNRKPEYSFYIGCVCAILIFGYTLRFLTSMLDKYRIVQEIWSDEDGYLATLMKVIGITYICEFASGICKDAGYGSVAGQIEILGKLSVIFAGLPILFAVMEQIRNFV